MIEAPLNKEWKKSVWDIRGFPILSRTFLSYIVWQPLEGVS